MSMMEEDVMTVTEELCEAPEEPMQVEGSELENFEKADIEQKEFIEDEKVLSIIESILFSTDRPQSLSSLKQAFKGTVVDIKKIKSAIDELMVLYAGGDRGVSIEEVSGGYQLRTKPDNMVFLKRMVKARPFKLSTPALEVLSIVVYKQPCVKFHVDEIRGVESGHLIRALMDKGLLSFAGKSELPGKPMLYQTTRKFLEIFGLRNLKELPSIPEIDELLPEGIESEPVEQNETLGEVAGSLQQEAITSYSSSSDELDKISGQLSEISISSEFFEEEKRRKKEKQESERAQDIRESLEFGEEVCEKDKKWLEKYDHLVAEAQLAEDSSVSIEAPLLTEDSAEGESPKQHLDPSSPPEGTEEPPVVAGEKVQEILNPKPGPENQVE